MGIITGINIYIYMYAAPPPLALFPFVERDPGYDGHRVACKHQRLYHWSPGERLCLVWNLFWRRNTMFLGSETHSTPKSTQLKKPRSWRNWKFPMRSSWRSRRRKMYSALTLLATHRMILSNKTFMMLGQFATTNLCESGVFGFGDNVWKLNPEIPFVFLYPRLNRI